MHTGKFAIHLQRSTAKVCDKCIGSYTESMGSNSDIGKWQCHTYKLELGNKKSIPNFQIANLLYTQLNGKILVNKDIHHQEKFSWLYLRQLVDNK